MPTAALQAAVIIGSGSASFEMLRYLTERLPAMVTPKWVETRIQPIAVHDVLRYLAGCAALPPDVSRRFDIGGPDVLTYAEMMRRYSGVAGLRPRVLVPVPLLTPRLSSLWVGLVTPVPAGLARPLVESLRNEVVCSEHDIASYVPDPPEGLLPVDRAIALALRHTREGAVSTRWSSAATPGAPSDPLPSDPSWAGGSLYALRPPHCGGSSRASGAAGPIPALREERPDTAVTAESARRSSFAVRADLSWRSAATARRWTSSRASGSVMASSSQVRSRADRKTHMLSVPSSSRLEVGPKAARSHAEDLGDRSTRRPVACGPTSCA